MRKLLVVLTLVGIALLSLGSPCIITQDTCELTSDGKVITGMKTIPGRTCCANYLLRGKGLSWAQYRGIDCPGVE